MWPPLPPIPWGAGSPFFLYPASSPSPNNLFSQTSTCSKPSPSHLTIQSMSTLQRCFFKKTILKIWKSCIASQTRARMVFQLLAFVLAQISEHHTPCFCQGGKYTFLLYLFFIFSHMWEEFAILATIKPADQQVGHSLWFDHQVRSTAVQLGL